ncbi:PREDICTED: pre-mRNA-splicing factor SPF27-like [Acropora digitifera]|uniref:pre-mRNA-splicing factor SPF27-like n=1 Tax=Acropora digitifera TaxID=70779 RepID=UPI00077A0AD4|nr:PREDICTED: pre-mRNA-splicing factor SPF27-like [Acropora digitifera]
MAAVHEVAPDALPYFDQGYDDPGVREMVNQLVEEETRRYRPTKNYLDFLPTPDYDAFETPILRKEFERISKRQPMDLLSMKRYELPQPTANQKHDITSWTEAVDNSMAQLEHQAERIENLELLSQYGSAAWKVHNETLTRILAQQQKKLMDIKKEIQEINWKRKTEQVRWSHTSTVHYVYRCDFNHQVDQ